MGYNDLRSLISKKQEQNLEIKIKCIIQVRSNIKPYFIILSNQHHLREAASKIHIILL
jgi:hypothetical protein